MVVDLGSTLHLRSLGCAFCRWCPDDRCSCKCQRCGRLQGAKGGCFCPDGPTVRVKWDSGALPCEGDWGSFFHERAFRAVKSDLVDLLELDLLDRKKKDASERKHCCRYKCLVRCDACYSSRLAARLDDTDNIRRTWLRHRLTGRYKSYKPRRTGALYGLVLG